MHKKDLPLVSLKELDSLLKEARRLANVNADILQIDADEEFSISI